MQKKNFLKCKNRYLITTIFLFFSNKETEESSGKSPQGKASGFLAFFLRFRRWWRRHFGRQRSSYLRRCSAYLRRRSAYLRHCSTYLRHHSTYLCRPYTFLRRRSTYLRQWSAGLYWCWSEEKAIWNAFSSRQHCSWSSLCWSLGSCQ